MSINSNVRYVKNKWSVILRDGRATDPAPKDPPADPPKDPPAEPKSWKEFFDSQPDPIKKLYESDHAELLNSVKATRGERDAALAKVNELMKKVEKGSESEALLQELQKNFEGANKKNAFYESGLRPEIGCKNLEVAYLIATSKNLYKSDGSPDWEEIKKAFPEGFGVSAGDPPKDPANPPKPLSPADPKGGAKLTKDAIQKMSAEEINKNWDAVQEFLKSQ